MLRERTRPARPGFGRVLRVVGVMAVLGALAMLPWRDWRRQFAVVTRVDVRGTRYLDAAKVRELAGLATGQDLFALDLVKARQLLLLNARIQAAKVERAWPRAIRIEIQERMPALLVQHGEPWEVDGDGVLLQPLQAGVVADVPLLTGAEFSKLPPGAQIHTADVQRGLAWVASLSDNALRLVGQVSEVDVSDREATSIVLLSGTRVLAPPFPPDVRQLSGLRVTLADLEHKGLQAGEVDVRFKDQVIVRSVRSTTGPVAQDARPM